MRKFVVFLLVITMVISSTLAGCSPSSEDVREADVSTEEAIAPLISFDFETSDVTQNQLIDSLDPELVDISSPFYIPETFIQYLNDATYIETRDILITDIVMSASRITELADQLNEEMIPYQNDLFGVFDSFIALDEELPYIYAASNRYADALLEESILEANLEFAGFDGHSDFVNASIIYMYVLDAEAYGLKVMDHLNWITTDGANLYMASELIGDAELTEVMNVFKQSMLSADTSMETTMTELAQEIMFVHDGLKRLDEADQYMTLAGMKFIQSQLPELRNISADLEPNEHIDEIDIAAISDFIDLMEVYAAGTELLYLEDSNYDLALESWEWQQFVQYPDMKWYDLMPISYAAVSSQTAAEMTAYQKKAKEVMTKMPPEVKEKAGLFGSIWNNVQSAASWGAGKARDARQGVGYALDYTVAMRKSAVDKGMGYYYNLSQKDIDDAVAKNYAQVEENYKKGIAGSTVMNDAKQFIQNIEDLPGEILYTTVGENAVTKTIDNTSKFVTGCFTSFAKGMFTIGDGKATNSQLANATFDVATSFVSVTKVAKFFGAPFVKAGAAVTGAIGKGAKSVVTSIAKTGSKYVGKFLAKAPPLLGTEVKKNLGKMVNVYSKYWYDGAVNITKSIGGIISKKTAPMVSSIKTLTNKAVSSIKNSSIVKKIVSKASDFAGDMGKILKEKLGDNFADFMANYVETEGWNAVKEVNETLEAIYDRFKSIKAVEDMDALVKAKKNSQLPKPQDIKIISDKKSKEASQKSGSSQSTATTETQPEQQSATEVQPETKPEIKPEVQPEPEPEPEDTEENQPNIDPTEFEGTYIGSASEIVFYDTDAGQMSFPIGSEHSTVQMTVLDDGNVVFAIAIYGTQMFDFDATVSTSQPATYNGSTFTCRFSDFEGANTTVSGSISKGSFNGSIGVYDEKNTRIGHISFGLIGN